MEPHKMPPGWRDGVGEDEARAKIESHRAALDALRATLELAHKLALPQHGTNGRDAYSRLTSPRPGDFVLILDSFREPERGFGVLESISREGIFTGRGEPFPADEYDGDPEPQDTYYTLRLPDGTSAKWYNCMPIAAPFPR
jgi:hypothetical protein